MPRELPSLIADALDSTFALANSLGSISTSYTYEPFGRLANPSPTDTNPYQFTGRENDGIGLYYYRARYYSPTLQRFLSQDPLPKELTGSPNVYEYALDNPLSGIDPLGLTDWTEQQTQQLLQQAYDDATAGRLQGLKNIYNNSRANGPYDFGWNEKTASDTWTRCGKRLDADQFANYVAGFQGAAYDSNYYWTTGGTWAEAAVKAAGMAFHLADNTKATDDPFDFTGLPYINSGERDGWTFRRRNGNCECKRNK